MPRLLKLLALLILVLLCFASPALAADEPGHGSHGAPNAMEFREDTAIWSVVVFGVLLFILWTKAWPSVLEGLQKREETIRTSLEEAKKTRTDMEAMRAEFQKELAAAHQQIPQLMEDARKKAEALSNEMRAKAVADIQTERDRLRHEVETAKDQAIKELWEQASQLATLISAKAIGRSLTEDDHRRLLDEAMGEMSQAARN
jgi:F-type H+-transporting ATPase subunit b